MADESSSEKINSGDVAVKKLVSNDIPSKKDCPVIQMQDFSAVNMEEKLNLLMVAINKINTNFYYKSEDLNKQLNVGKEAIIPRLMKCKEAIAAQYDVLNDEADGLNTP